MSKHIYICSTEKLNREKIKRKTTIGFFVFKFKKALTTTEIWQINVSETQTREQKEKNRKNANKM